MDALLNTGSIPIVLVLIRTDTTNIWLDVPLKVWVIRTSGVYHNTLWRDFLTSLVTIVIG
jgi:hypothetical protein